MERRSSLVRDSAWVGGGMLVASGAGLASNLLIARLMPVADAGLFFLAVSASVTLAFVARLGLESSIVRRLAEARASGGDAGVVREIRLQIVCTALVGLVAAVALISLGWRVISLRLFDSEVLAASAVVVSLWVLGEVLRLPFSESLRGLHDIPGATILGNAGRAASFVLLLPLLWVVNDAGHNRLEWALRLAMSVSLAVAFAALVLLLRRVGTGVFGAFMRPAISRTFRMSWPFYVTTVWSFAGNQGDVLVAGVVLSSTGVALYAAAAKISLLLNLPATALNQLLAPEIPKLWADSEVGKLEQRIRAITTAYAIPIVGVACLLIFGNSWVVGLLLPPEYAAAGPVLAILAIGPLATALSGPNGFTLMMTGHAMVVARITSMVSVVQLASMIPAGMLLGPVGLAAASSAGTVALRLVLSGVVRQRIGITTLPYVRPRQLRASLGRSRVH